MRISELVPERPKGALEFTVKQRLIRGKWREIAVPSPALKNLHRELKVLLEESVEGVSLSPIKNLFAHARGRFFFQTDLKSAFPSIKTKRLAGVLCTLVPGIGEYEEVVAFLERYCMLSAEGNLAQGGPASPLLFELYCRWYLDRPIKELLVTPQGAPGSIVYTRYVDDLTFSSQEKIGLRVRKKLKKVIRGAGFRLQGNKTTLRQRGKQKIVITGGRLPPGRHAALTEEFYRKLDRQLSAFFRGELADDGLPSLRGNLAWFDQFESKLTGTRRGRLLRRVSLKVDEAKALLARIKEESPKKGRALYRFPKQWLDELRERAEIVPYVRRHLPQYRWAPKATGIRCPCPFCNARGSTFTVSPAKRSFHCGNCKRHGDVIRFAMLQSGEGFVATTVKLAAQIGLGLPEEYYRRPGTRKPVESKQLTLFETSG